jgi:hypothetical protein
LAVTGLEIGISIRAISLRTKWLVFWLLGLASGATGLFLPFSVFSSKPIQLPSYGHKH